jgi:CDP-glucose 4,6-dehydratase
VEAMEVESILEKFKDKKVFITGHSGFKGSWLTYALDNAGATTKGYSLKPISNPNLYSSLSFSKNHSSVFSDINNFEKLKKELNSFKPDYIFHLAAQPLVLESLKDPKHTFETNFNGTLNLLEILREVKFATTAVFITTDKVYENKDLNHAFDEEDRLGGKDPYSSSKAASELVIKSYYLSYFKDSKINIASARAGNVIGGGDWSEDRLIPDIVRSLFENNPLIIRNPMSTRPWQHVLESITGYLLLAVNLSKNPSSYSGAWNFGPEIGDDKSVKNIIDISSELGFKLNVSYDKNTDSQEAKYLSLEINKSKALLKWIPKWNSYLAISKTLIWYKHFYKGENPNILLERDLKSYLNKI